jgi:excisionase family DNA binding protein
MKEILGVQEVGKMLGISPATVSKMARSGELPARKYAGAYKFDIGEIREWMEARATGQPENEPDPIHVPDLDIESVAKSDSRGNLLSALLSEQRETRRLLVRLLNRLLRGRAS